MPFFGDQHYWGAAVQRKGLGPAPCPVDKLTTERLVGMLRTLHEPGVRAAAAAAAAQIAQVRWTCRCVAASRSLSSAAHALLVAARWRGHGGGTTLLCSVRPLGPPLLAPTSRACRRTAWRRRSPASTLRLARFSIRSHLATTHAQEDGVAAAVACFHRHLPLARLVRGERVEWDLAAPQVSNVFYEAGAGELLLRRSISSALACWLGGAAARGGCRAVFYGTGRG